MVPVYQRQYRWDIGGCEQLLADIRAVADSEDRQTHFIGSILSTDERRQRMPGARAYRRPAADHHAHAAGCGAAPHRRGPTSPALAAELEQRARACRRPDRTKLRPHRAWAQVFESVVLDRRPADAELRDSRFDDNYAFFRSQIPAEEAPRIWRGLQRLEHVSITLGADANAQQTFESLNSTGEPLRDHELIHNYVLMGLSHARADARSRTRSGCRSSRTPASRSAASGGTTW